MTKHVWAATVAAGLTLAAALTGSAGAAPASALPPGPTSCSDPACDFGPARNIAGVAAFGVVHSASDSDPAEDF